MPQPQQEDSSTSTATVELNFKDTELTLGLPGAKSTNKRIFSHTTINIVDDHDNDNDNDKSSITTSSIQSPAPK